MKTALVLGAGGFIGGHLARKLKREDFWAKIYICQYSLLSS